MRFEEYRKHDAISLAGLIAEREISAEEVLEAAIARAEQVHRERPRRTSPDRQEASL